MKSNRLSASSTGKIRVKGPYNKKEILYLKGHIAACLLVLADTGKKINYEELFLAIGSVPNSIYAPEWEEYWGSKAKKIGSIITRTKRQKFFKENIQDALVKGIFPTDPNSISGLTGNFSQTIQSIINKNPTT